MAREYVWLECGESGQRNYRTPKETRGTDRLELKKYCKKLRRHRHPRYRFEPLIDESHDQPTEPLNTPNEETTPPPEAEAA